MQMPYKDIEIDCPYCNKSFVVSRRLYDEEEEDIVTCPHRSCHKKFVLAYNTQITYKIYKLVGAEIKRIAK